MSKKVIYQNNGDFPVFEPQFIVETDCFRCGNRTRVLIDKDEEFDEANRFPIPGDFDYAGVVNWKQVYVQYVTAVAMPLVLALAYSLQLSATAVAARVG